jgi:hypothetical protein
MTAAAARTPLLTAPAVVPVHSPRTWLILAELARQRRYGRRHRPLKRHQRRFAWISAWLAALRWPFESGHAHTAPRLLFAGSTPLVYALQQPWLTRVYTDPRAGQGLRPVGTLETARRTRHTRDRSRSDPGT